ncbi:MAG: DUF885 domain-containing protein [Flavobacteriaceae bacterium]|nr:DUF885 domain-containing protein [Flavobacteriaceae bacterium]MCY4268141.1 DUF885 domain-containing protein [Flavobacteriaceae bacterium]MCY4298965.1 DUF885 domain-containing protein [Flavobacteriaceae bacterium]
MNQHKNFLTICVLVGLFIGCQQTRTDQQKLHEIIQSFENRSSISEEFPLGDYTQERFDNDDAFYQELQEKLVNIDAQKLEESDRISHEILSFLINEERVQYKFNRHWNPILSDAGFHISLTFHVRELRNRQAAIDYLKFLEAIPTYIQQQKELILKGINAGISQPLVIFSGYESSYQQHITSTAEENYYFSPLKNLPTILPKTFKDSVVKVGTSIITQKVIPTFQSIEEFFKTQYLPQTRTTIGTSEIPDGLAYYKSRIHYYTTLDLTAQEIHDKGIEEVSRIRNEMLSIIEDLNFQGDFDDFLNYLRRDPQFYAKTPNELLMFARDVSKRLDEQLPRYFITLPRKPYGVAKVPDAIAPKYTGGRYVGTNANSTEPGYYLVNTYNLPSRPLFVIPSLTAHEAVPGHHLQVALSKEMSDETPKFRRQLYLSAYGEGWALYTEFLADEMGIYRTPYEQFGRLTYEMWRACRLVVDTGIHAFGWTRSQAVDYMKKNTALSTHEINTEVDRYISWPGQALSYKIGELKIRELRKMAESELGSDFEIRAFHEVILEEGVVTLPILEQRILDFIDRVKKEN